MFPRRYISCMRKPPILLPGATVGEIARRWGWASPANFATAYRKHFGVSPSHTLRT